MSRSSTSHNASQTDPDPRALQAVALEAARACGIFLLEAFNRPKGAYEEKSPGDLVSEVDRHSQDIARRLLKERTPDALFVEEEGAESRSVVGDDSRSLIWIVDPLDGTTNFLHRFPVFAVSIAAAQGRSLKAGVVFNPVTDECFTAARGYGARLNGDPIQVSTETYLKRALIATGWPFRRKPLLERYLEVFQRIFHACQGIRRAGAASIDLAYVAAGRLEGFWEFDLSLWDIAAGALIVEEAGGRISDFSGKDGWWDSGDVVASNGHVHNQIIKAAATPGGIRDLEVSG